MIQGASANLNNAKFQEFSLLLHNHGFFYVVAITIDYSVKLVMLGQGGDIHQITLFIDLQYLTE